MSRRVLDSGPYGKYTDATLTNSASKKRNLSHLTENEMARLDTALLDGVAGKILMKRFFLTQGAVDQRRKELGLARTK